MFSPRILRSCRNSSIGAAFYMGTNLGKKLLPSVPNDDTYENETLEVGLRVNTCYNCVFKLRTVLSYKQSSQTACRYITQF